MDKKALLRRLALALCLITFLSLGVTQCAAVGPRGAAPGAVSLRINTSHALENARGAVLDAGLNLSEQVRITPSSPDQKNFLSPERFIEDAKSVGATILSSSCSHWQSLFDSVCYPKLTKNGMVHVYAYEPRQSQPENAPPPAAFVTVNRIGGKTGHGIEFGVPQGYMHGKGQGSTPSGVTAQLAGLMACLKFQHPQWNWFDVKAALRSTAANYPTGYNPRNYGYGVIDYPAANALRDAKALPLCPPAAVLRPLRGDAIFFSVNPFQQSRRVADALFKFKAAPAPCLGELSLAGIVALGGQQVYLADVAKSGNSVGYRAAREETAYFVWFTKDAAGKFSRIEPYSILGPVHLQPQAQSQPHYPPQFQPQLQFRHEPQPLYGPRVNPVQGN